MAPWAHLFLPNVVHTMTRDQDVSKGYFKSLDRKPGNAGLTAAAVCVPYSIKIKLKLSLYWIGVLDGGVTGKPKIIFFFSGTS